MFIKIPVKGKAESNFWIRAFQLEGDIQGVMAKLDEDFRRKTAFVPIIAEHEAGSILWIYFLGVSIDSLGVREGMGYVWLTTGEPHRDQALGERNKIADFVFKTSKEQGKFDEIIEIETRKDV